MCEGFQRELSIVWFQSLRWRLELLTLHSSCSQILLVSGYISEPSIKNESLFNGWKDCLELLVQLLEKLLISTKGKHLFSYCTIIIIIMIIVIVIIIIIVTTIIIIIIIIFVDIIIISILETKLWSWNS